MLRILAVPAILVALAAPLRAQSAAEAIETVIAAQLEAFRSDEPGRAFSYASPAIKDLFETPERFERMVATGYPMVRDPGEVTYLSLSEQGAGRVQTVMITDAAGTLHTLAYEMIETPEGWQINGVRILETGEVGA